MADLSKQREKQEEYKPEGVLINYNLRSGEPPGQKTKNKKGNARANGSPEQKTIAEPECTGGRFWEGWGPGAVEDVPENEARRELQEGTQAGSTGRGRNGGRNRGLDLGGRGGTAGGTAVAKGGRKIT